MNFLELFPDRDRLLHAYREEKNSFPLKVNSHIHTPYSFSAFESVSQAVRSAIAEEVRILGINDFYVTDGYGEFTGECLAHGIFPLWNIELIGISPTDQAGGIRVNDPGNPGRIYICGKGLSYEAGFPEDQARKLGRIVEESNLQVARMIGLLNGWLKKQQVEISLSVEEIMGKHAVHLLRERHVAKMLRLKLEESASGDAEFYRELTRLYGGDPPGRKRSDIAGIEDELRSRLLKAGAPAFVPEDEKAFLSVDEITRIIRNGGGIPTYPVLLDGTGGEATEFERNKEQLLEALENRGFRSVEFIPLRNRFEKLKEYAEFFYERSFVVSFGTEHNTSAMVPLAVSCRGGVPLDDRLMQISFNGAAFVAAHQYLAAREGPGAQDLSRQEMELLGKAVFQYYFNEYHPSLTDH
jgi:hypothetical protein